MSTGFKELLARVRTMPPGGLHVLVISFYLLATVSLCHAGHVVMSPLDGKQDTPSGRHVGFVLIPELGISHTDYKSLCRQIQSLYPLKLWAAITDTSRESYISMDNLPLLLMEAINELHYPPHRMSTNVDIFLVAHGHTAHTVADYAEAEASMYAGLIILGALLPRAPSFPLPVLTIVGELDGLARITKLASALHEMTSSRTHNPAKVIENPIVVLEGSNHAVFVTSELPHSLHQQDIEPDADVGVSREMAAHKTAVFLARVVRQPQTLSDQAEVEFTSSFDKAMNITLPIRQTQSMTQTVAADKCDWVRSAQKWLSGLEGEHSTLLEVEPFIVHDKFLALPPDFVTDQGVDTVMTFSQIISHPDSTQHAPDEIAARMMSAERIQDYLRHTDIGRNYSCMDLNYAAYQVAYHTASPQSRDRYDRRHRGMTFDPDLVTDSKVVWENSPLKVDTTDGEMRVKSTSYRTKVDPGTPEQSGLFYCKLLPPDRAIEWIYVDSLRRNVPVKSRN